MVACQVCLQVVQVREPGILLTVGFATLCIAAAVVQTRTLLAPCVCLL